MRPPGDDPYEETVTTVGDERRRRIGADATFVPPLGWVGDDEAAARRLARRRILAVAVGSAALVASYAFLAGREGLVPIPLPAPAAIAYGVAVVLVVGWIGLTAALLASDDGDRPSRIRWKVREVAATQAPCVVLLCWVFALFRPVP